MKVDRDILKILDRCATAHSCLYLPEQLDRKVYQSVAKVIEAAGGKWDRKKKAHIFEGDAADAMESIILTGEYTRNKQDFGQFDTPESLAVDLVGRAEVAIGMVVLEPSCGTGNIAAAIELAGGIVTAFEVDAKRSLAAAKKCAFKGQLHLRDFLSEKPSPTFDRVIMNPPFSKQADIDHVMHALTFLKPGGFLTAIMSAGTEFRETRKATAFRALMSKMNARWSDLPAGSFSSVGTNCNTIILRVWNDGRKFW